jgi:hypothetical protein
MSPSGEPSQSHTVRRAIEIVAEQLHTDGDVAFEALEGVAAASDEPLEDVAIRVLEGTVRFDA